jgi:hypothetical protein
MITERGRRLIETAERYVVPEAELLEIIRDCVCEYYKIDKEIFCSSRLKKEPYASARERYLMVAVNSTTKASYHKISKTIDRSHCMVVIAKRKVLQLEDSRVWEARLAREYNELSEMVISRIVSTKIEPVERDQKSFLFELVGIMNGLKSSGSEDVEVDKPKHKLLNILSMVYVAEKKGQYAELVRSLNWVRKDRVGA